MEASTTDNPHVRRLLEGNERFVLGQSKRTFATDRLSELAEGQAPFAVVLGCSDSRVPVETIFDQEPGDLFVVRIAGNYATPDVLGSIEFAVSILKTPLLLVLGHSTCGAVGAAINYVRTGQEAPAHIQLLAKAVEPAARATQRAEDWTHAAVAENVRLNRKAVVTSSDIIGQAQRNRSLTIAGGVYDLRSGVVSILE